MKTSSLTGNQRLFLGCVTLLCIALTVSAPASISLYLLGLCPAAIVILVFTMTRDPGKLALGRVWLGMPALALLLIATAAGVYQLRIIRSIDQLSALRRTLLGRPEIQIGQPLPTLGPERRIEIAKLDELPLRRAESLGWTTVDAYSDAGALSILDRNFTRAGRFLNAAQKSPPDASTTNNLGVAYYYDGLREKAAVEFRRAAMQIERQEATSSSRNAAAVIYANLGVVLRDRGEEGLNNGDIRQGISFRDNGELDEALSTFHTALEKSNDPGIILTTKLQIAAVYRIENRYEDALTIANEVLSTPELSEYLRASALKIQGLVAEDRNQSTKALECYSQAAAKYEKGGYLQDLAVVLNNIGNVYINEARPEPEKALAYQREALKLNEQLGLDIDAAIDRANMAYIYYESGDLTRAAELARAALAVYQLHKGPLGAEAAALDTIGLIEQKNGHSDTARSNFEQSLEFARRAGDRHGQAEVLGHLALLLANQKLYETAEPLALEAVAIYEQIGNKEKARDSKKMYDSWYRLSVRHSPRGPS